MSEEVIRFENFTFQYSAQAEPTVHDISFSVRRGEKVLIAGPSGSGKSTLIHCINGLIPFSYPGQSSGEVLINGRPVSEMSIFDISKTVGTVLQDSDGQFVGLTVAEDIAFALENDSVGTEELHERVRSAAQTVGLEGHLQHAPTELSGGQKQRTAIAGIMVDDVDVLLFDEMLANLDPATGKQAIELIDELQAKTGAAVIIVEHRLEDVLHRHVDRVILMSDGRIVADCTADELLSTALLRDNGIREPLYITALKYAGVEIKPEMHPWSIREIALSEEDREKVRSYFEMTPSPKPPETAPALLEAEDIDFSYSNGHRALKNISLRIGRGERVAIVGTNGAGKSTFSKLVCGFEKPQSGRLLFKGEDMASLSIKERADRIGYVMQNPNQMISKVMIFDEVALGLRSRGVPEEELKPRVEKALKTCGLWEFRSWPISALSYGQKKRVTIASILVLEPELIILDEVTAGQDYRHYTEIMEFLSRLNASGITTVMITHDMHLMLEYAHRALVFDNGELVADAPCADVLTDPEIIGRASLKETSLYELAVRCGIDSGREFVRRFIEYERKAQLND